MDMTSGWTLPGYEDFETIDPVQVAEIFGRTDDLFQIPNSQTREEYVNFIEEEFHIFKFLM